MSYQQPKNGMIGMRLPVRDAQVKVTGQLKYVADMKLPHMLHAKVLFSPVAHARIKHIDTSAAEALPGVRAVVCYKNAPDIPFNCCGENIDETKNERIFDPIVRYVGDKVAAVAADTVQIAEKALKLIQVEYEELPFYIDPEAAMKEDAYPIHEGGNIAEVVNLNQGDVDKGMEEADLVFEDRYSLPAIHHSAIETHAALAQYDANGKLTVWSPTQDAFAVRVNLSRLFGLKMSRVRVVASAIGGGFGGKIDMILEHVVSLLAIKTGRPVRLVYTRREDIPSSHSRHQMILYLKTGVKKDGTIVAQDFNVVINAGAYAGGTSSVAWAMGGKAFRIMDIPNIRFKATEVYTNCLCGAAMRGFGSPQEFFAQQRQLNQIAKALNMDLVDLILKNLKGEHGLDLRNNTPLGNTYAKACVEQGAALFDWKKALAEQEASRRENGRYRIGVGMAAATHGNGVFGVHPDTTGIILHMNEDGTVVLASGCCDMGNGSVTLQGQVTAEILGIQPSDIEYIQADTDATLWDFGNFSSRGTYVSANAAVKAANALKQMLLEEAADLLPDAIDRIVLHDGRAWSLNYPDRSATMAELAQHARSKNQRDLAVAETFASRAMAESYGAHFVKVQVDTETGEVKVLDYVASHDVGSVLNPMSVEGQIEGAIQMGLGYALCEGIVWDEKGRVKNSTFRTSHIFTADEMPPIRVTCVDKPEYTGPYGGKSIGECSVVPSPAAIANAVSNAVERDFHNLPLRKEVILAALNQP
ncbi:xanthine dehydrogenase family protein molybdopterin-binding subunit [Pseudoflavonifractor sp. 524-17]|uniref:xanthine dehydrogenase family protein molybdopterin-binding subunit n=1 Tax=Pseudoflavonifractor sp. 524-17 TaxID=2304577 RepID=UPI001379CEA2|nr:xanthine dehydrogenase family protein molybdopterin-binding subunit [Pseudoflavonifractor sp. 524-17]NCE63959.1 xanthine dehydrogenase family protein molybdopterin-binding subunit [Pseudoflavonifractor sp. 524-17]